MKLQRLLAGVLGLLCATNAITEDKNPPKNPEQISFFQVPFS